MLNDLKKPLSDASHLFYAEKRGNALLGAFTGGKFSDELVEQLVEGAIDVVESPFYQFLTLLSRS